MSDIIFFLNDITFYYCFPESLEANKFPQYCLNPYLTCNHNKAAADCFSKYKITLFFLLLVADKIPLQTQQQQTLHLIVIVPFLFRIRPEGVL